MILTYKVMESLEYYKKDFSMIRNRQVTEEFTKKAKHGFASYMMALEDMGLESDEKQKIIREVCGWKKLSSF